ncbi:MAG: hypothetical protein COX12_00520 [Candidatus Brennerbacteria bacterium CG23_combo_of_CG06-09_8_20_14_all_44_41]|uniref:DUF763 domain-containing protein n=2 Tax=Candidatus Brenneribacteriota TaxID=1817902 RepID=A0A2H9N6C5_9BACT|nr:MAG: hypothetical protein AUJ43_02035 [Parcubacteria group bacterium CG1_02_44_31]PIP50577.1 MAG: hypothetical protein COX12_00520 [Candidatus Brennerbacteria bacterium CG23_combo_of_CG06-09_8_20_14_all_44_41]PIX29403.1 MAG: DUF763 domain-containing protein [Candidatus Brennerbacteria bacterium CG_4_8_14_3_um_filter_43_14]PJA19074.1 MAG: DUF763 domain-containing protein [Candidatus Brennerbacteria bacterium CG_4_10_14_0_2_um_filter_43_14]
MDRGIATFTLDWGKCPRWLFDRMVYLGKEMIHAIVLTYGPDEFIKRIGDPVWFQSLGTVLAFDWNASGLTTILTAALKQAIRGEEKDLGIFICGGKGKTSRKTPDEIHTWGDRLLLASNTTTSLEYNSRMAAKVDSALVQDGFQIYHHSFFFSRNGAWTVVQQGMNTATQSARRYHWHSAYVHDLICEPHSGIVSQTRVKRVLDLTSRKSTHNRQTGVALLGDGYRTIAHDIQMIQSHRTPLSHTLSFAFGNDRYTAVDLARHEFSYHPVVEERFWDSLYLQKMLKLVCERKPVTYEAFLAMPGVGPKTVRALALVGEIIYGARPSYDDPARYSFAHGGKDATPYPVDTKTYDNTIRFLQDIILKTRVSPLEKNKMFQRLSLLGRNAVQ